jgi:hypothetical protein
MKARDYLVVFGIISAPLVSIWLSSWLLGNPAVVLWLRVNSWAEIPLHITLWTYGILSVLVCVGNLINLLSKKIIP